MNKLTNKRNERDAVPFHHKIFNLPDYSKLHIFTVTIVKNIYLVII